MKLMTYCDPATGVPRIGALMADGSSVADLQAGAIIRTGRPSPHLTEMLAFLEGGSAAREEAESALAVLEGRRPEGTVHSLAVLRLLAPVPRPRSIRDCMAFKQHVIQATRTVIKWHSPALARLDAWVERRRGRGLRAPAPVWYEMPLYYKGNVGSVVGPEAEVIWPAYTERLDFELEFGVYIGKAGKDIRASDALTHIGGYTIFNDFSARDIQIKEMAGGLGPTKSKDFDTGNAMGPYLVTPDEVDPYNLKMVVRVNGEVWGSGSSREMHYTFEEMIAYMSKDETLLPGDFIASGTVGNGAGLELDRWLRPGDVVELEVEGLGVLRNRVIRGRSPAR